LDARGGIAYIGMMVMLWFPGSYGIFAGGQWSFGCKLMLAVGGTEFLRPLKLLNTTHEKWQVSRFNDLMDTFMAIIIASTVDTCFMWLLYKSERHKVAEAAAGVLDASASLLQGIITLDQRYYNDQEDLRGCTDLQSKNEIRRAYFKGVARTTRHDSYARSFESTWQMPYKKRLVHDLLQQFDAVHVATYSLLTSAERCDRRKLMQIISSTLPLELVDKYREYARVAKGAISQTSPLQPWGFSAEVPFGPILEGQPPAVLNMHFQGLAVSDCSANGQMPPVRRSLIRHQSSFCPDNAAEAAATLHAIHGVLAIRLALERVEVVLRDEEFITFGHWGFEQESNLEAIRPADKRYFRRRHPRVWLSSSEAKDQQQFCTPRFRSPLPHSPVPTRSETTLACDSEWQIRITKR